MSDWDGKWKEMCSKISQNDQLVKLAIQDVFDNAVADFPEGSAKEILSDQAIGFGGFLADRFVSKFHELMDTMSHWTD